MDSIDRRTIKNEAAESLAGAAFSPGKLVLIHTAVSAGLALLTALVSFLLEQQIADTGGLSGIGSRSALETAQSLLQIANMILLPFWGVGLLWSFMHISRHESSEPRDLLMGFRLVGPVLRVKILHALILSGAIFLGCYLGMFLYTLTPLSANLYTVAEPYITDGVLDYAVIEDPAFIAVALWAIPFIAGGAALAAVPLFYRLRLIEYILLDQPEKGAFHAMRTSKALMRGHRWELFRLDLSFWWFYLLELAVLALSYGDLILPVLGVDLGIHQTTAYFLFYVLALAAQLGLYVWKKPQLMATYARYYDVLRPKPQEEEPPAFSYTM